MSLVTRPGHPITACSTSTGSTSTAAPAALACPAASGGVGVWSVAAVATVAATVLQLRLARARIGAVVVGFDDADVLDCGERVGGTGGGGEWVFGGVARISGAQLGPPAWAGAAVAAVGIWLSAGVLALGERLGWPLLSIGGCAVLPTHYVTGSLGTTGWYRTVHPGGLRGHGGLGIGRVVPSWLGVAGGGVETTRSRHPGRREARLASGRGIRRAGVWIRCGA